MKKEDKDEIINFYENRIKKIYSDNIKYQMIIVADLQFDENNHQYGKTVYYDIELGDIQILPFDTNDSTKYETTRYKLMRFQIDYIDVAKTVALNVMNKKDRLGFNLYTECGTFIK